jgi:hypothetical protein
MELLTLGEIYDLAEEVYGQALPEFWRQWKSWNDGWGTGQPGDPILD